jgi:carboxylesterase type B
MDKTVLRGTAKKDFVNDNYLHVPIMEGTTSSEGRAFGLFMLINRPQAITYLREEFDPNARDNKSATQLLTLQEQMMFALVDPIMTLGTQISETSLLNTIAGSNKEDIFVYRFQYDNAPQPMDTLFASGHMSELPFVFGNIQADSAAENSYAYFQDADRTLSERTRLSNRMMNYWGSFVRTGNPNDSVSRRQPRWNSYSSL